ncbi:MAG: hypothetical protein KJ550_03415 [Proteobacteria bacterium]|nr:hypothetical protein [Pseudomonadota bacterium]MBU3980934.1 hypothetical protein [Pseudomonadota bacterium]MBU4012494.1 hypothetical protein [Pseudomonadota bacterium]MBU4068988.1 hypothetical protein [Pseudomonadota bacterium]MBU4100678.1 hypothetical protein [Pseudomonadota bacterium]
MKITYIVEKINLNQVMDISVDVHKDNLSFFFLLLIAGNILTSVTIVPMLSKGE